MLFSPIGGGIAPPSAALAAAPDNDTWHYITGTWPGLGTGGNNVDYLAILNVSGDVCNQINNQVGISNTILNSLATNDVIGAATPPATAGTNVAGIADVSNELAGHTIGCFGSTHSGTPTYYFYEVIYVQ
jgi:hypothetical protein